MAADLPGCQQCLEFGCVGGFAWNCRAEVPLLPGDSTLDVTTNSATHPLACTINADPTLSACTPTQRRDPAADEHATVSLAEAAAGFP